MSFTGCATADSYWLFIALGEGDDPATITNCEDGEAVLAAVKANMFMDDGEPLSAEHAEEVRGVTDTLIQEGRYDFEGDPGFRLYRVWKPREQAIADIVGVEGRKP